MSDDTATKQSKKDLKKAEMKAAKAEAKSLRKIKKEQSKDATEDSKSSETKTEKSDKKNKKRKREEEVAEEPKKSKKSKKSKREEQAAEAVVKADGVNESDIETKAEEALEAEKVLVEVKEKKDKKKSKKRKHNEETADLAPEEPTADAEPTKSEKQKSKKSKKNSKQPNGEFGEAAEVIAANGTTTGEDEIPVLREPTKKELKELKRKAKKDAGTSIPAVDDSVGAGDESVAQQADAPNVEGITEEGTEQKKHRFIVFVGNLAFSTTKDALAKHFAKITPISIRLMTDRQTKKSKGFAFLDFEDYDKMKTCLKLYHHTQLDGRKINVELTAGGGGNKTDRKDKIQAKNEKLYEERQRRHVEEEKKKQREEKKSAKGKSGKKTNAMGAGNPHGLDGTTDEPVGHDKYAGIHPSRLAGMQF